MLKNLWLKVQEKVAEFFDVVSAVVEDLGPVKTSLAIAGLWVAYFLGLVQTVFFWGVVAVTVLVVVDIVKNKVL
jgi:hypothetical protein